MASTVCTSYHGFPKRLLAVPAVGKQRSLSLSSRRKVSCKYRENEEGSSVRVEMLYGSTSLGADPLAMTAPVQAPDISKCGPPDISGEKMGNFYSAARDPIFFAHHGNIDRLWTIWKSLGGRRKDPRDPDWLNADDPKRTEHLLALDGAKERLQSFKANLLEEGSFDAPVDGCEGVFHMASPYYHAVTDPQAELIDPAVKGTFNVLGSCVKAPSVKRVVVTSSVAAVAYNGKPQTPDVVVDETWFSNPEFCKEMKMWYVVSKTLAEEAAWKFAKEKGIDMVTINPAMVIGPLLQPTLNTSAEAVLNLIKGAQTFPNATFGWVNVKDVANAHIQAFEVPSASGRYVLVERVAHHSQVVKALRELYPALHLPEKCADDNPYVPTYQVSKEKTKSLGIDYIPLEVSLKETVESLKAKGFF